MAFTSEQQKGNKYGLRHGAYKNNAYSSWDCMKQRCLNPKNSNYSRYGGRGIKICDKWLSFEGFYSDMGDRSKGMSLDRIDVNGNYEPLNCRWATKKEQLRNKRNNNTVIFEGKKVTLSELCDIFSIRFDTLKARLIRGWSIEKAVKYPIQKKYKKKAA
jgi:hypothetical protein